MILLRLSVFDPILEGLHAVMHDIRMLLGMAIRQLRERPSWPSDSDPGITALR